MGKRWKVRKSSVAWAGAGLVACGGAWAQQANGLPPVAGAAANGMVASGASAGGVSPFPPSTPAASVSPPQAATAPLVLGLEAGARSWSHGIAPRWTADLKPRDDGVPAVSIVTLPAEQIPGSAPRRAHHALSVRSETSRQALRSLGLDVTECATRFRMPTRMRQSAQGGDSTLDAQAQVSWACRF